MKYRIAKEGEGIYSLTEIKEDSYYSGYEDSYYPEYEVFRGSLTDCESYIRLSLIDNVILDF